MPQPQLTDDELRTIRRLREDDELTYEQLGAALDVDTSTAHRILEKPEHQFADLVLIRIRKALRRRPAKKATTSSIGARA